MSSQMDNDQSWYQKNKDKLNKRRKELYAANPDKYRKRQMKYYLSHHEHCKQLLRISGRKNYKLLKDEVFNHYGGYKCKCECGCNEANPLMLTIDHINGNGTQHRKSIHNRNIYGWLRKNNWPSGFRVLCDNCNNGRFRNHGICPRIKSYDDMSESGYESQVTNVR